MAVVVDAFDVHPVLNDSPGTAGNFVQAYYPAAETISQAPLLHHPCRSRPLVVKVTRPTAKGTFRWCDESMFKESDMKKEFVYTYNLPSLNECGEGRGKERGHRRLLHNFMALRLQSS